MKLTNLIFGAAMALMAGPALADDGGFSDNSVGARYGTAFKEPGIGSSKQPHGEDIHKLILNFGHFDVWKYGSNFINIDALFSDGRDPANNSTDHGATEVYAVYRGQLSPDKLAGISTKFGPIEAINFEIGGDFNTKNTTFAPEKRLLVVGPNFHIAMPAGFFDIGVHLSKEWNYNGIVGKNVDFDATPEFEAVWLYPLGFTGLPLDFRGFANLVLPKGKDGFGANTAAEILARPQLQLDIGSMLFGKKHLPDLYFAVEYWWNKFGNDHTKVPGSYAITPMVGIELHF
jgi:nucleoside-specific outer membrane channel protein Tsx